MKKHLLTIFCFLFMLTACEALKKDGSNETREVTESAETLYTEAMDALETSRYKAAVNKFEDIERVYPYSKWATKAKVMAAYANFKDQEYDDAVLALERFIKLHPGHKDVAYAYYLRALCYYEQISVVSRDQGYTKLALESLREVRARFPKSEYAKDAEVKIDLVYDHLAGKEMDVGRFYLKRHQYVAAINRFERVVEDLDTTSHVPEALHRLVEAYMALGIRDQAKRYAAVLGHNYPGSKWYEYSYNLFPETKVTE